MKVIGEERVEREGSEERKRRGTVTKYTFLVSHVLQTPFVTADGAVPVGLENSCPKSVQIPGIGSRCEMYKLTWRKENRPLPPVATKIFAFALACVVPVVRGFDAVREKEREREGKEGKRREREREKSREKRKEGK